MHVGIEELGNAPSMSTRLWRLRLAYLDLMCVKRHRLGKSLSCFLSLFLLLRYLIYRHVPTCTHTHSANDPSQFGLYDENKNTICVIRTSSVQ